LKRFLLTACCLPFVFALASPGADWKPLLPEDLALQKPRVDAAADAEAMLWEISVADAAANNQYPYTVYNHYLRIKIFNDRGVKKFGTVDIEYSGKQNVSDLSARTIQPDGRIQEVTRSAVFDRIIEKRNGRKVHARSFALPGVKAGSIIEYRWRESHDDELANYVRLPAQRDIPVEHLVLPAKAPGKSLFPVQDAVHSLQC
jgi:hypothetical protein